MATIEVNKDNSLTLAMSEDERTTYDGLPAGQLAEFITLWLSERFKDSWKARIEKLSTPQKKILVGYLSDVADLKPDKPEDPQ